MRFSFTHYIERGDEEIELAVAYDVSEYYEATREQPAEGGEVELISVKCEGKEIALTDAEETALLAVCEERAGADQAEYFAEAAEWRAQCRRDDAMMAIWERDQ